MLVCGGNKLKPHRILVSMFALFTCSVALEPEVVCVVWSQVRGPSATGVL